MTIANIALVLAGFIAFLLLIFLRNIIGWFIHQPTRRKIVKAVTTVERSLSGFKTEVTAYKAALQTFIDQYANDSARFSSAFEAFKLNITRLSLPKMDPEKFKIIKDSSWIHNDVEPYYRAFYHAVILSGFCNLYREFLAQDNWHHIEAIDKLAASLYHHETDLKKKVDFLMQKTTHKDADYAVRYFEAFGRLIDQTLTLADSLETDLAYIKSHNRFVKLLAGWD